MFSVVRDEQPENMLDILVTLPVLRFSKPIISAFRQFLNINEKVAKCDVSRCDISANARGQTSFESWFPIENDFIGDNLILCPFITAIVFPSTTSLSQTS